MIPFHQGRVELHLSATRLLRLLLEAGFLAMDDARRLWPLRGHRSEAAYQKALREVHTAGLPLKLSMQWWKWKNMEKCHGPSIMVQPISVKLGMDYYWILLGSLH